MVGALYHGVLMRDLVVLFACTIPRGSNELFINFNLPKNYLLTLITRFSGRRNTECYNPSPLTESRPEIPVRRNEKGEAMIKGND